MTLCADGYRRWGTLNGLLVGAADFGVAAASFGLHELLRGLARGSDAQAVANAERVMRLERATGIFVELDLQRALHAHPSLLWFLYLAYSYFHLAVLILFVLWVLIRHRDWFGQIYVTFVLTIVVALVVYVLFPLAPPRFFPQLGFVDTVGRFGGVSAPATAHSLLSNPFAAMPSLHVAWALFVALGVIRIVRKPLAWLALLYWLLIGVAVVATANHFVLDAIAGTLLTLLAYVTAWWVVPRLPAHALLHRRGRQAIPAPLPHTGRHDSLLV